MNITIAIIHPQFVPSESDELEEDVELYAAAGRDDEPYEDEEDDEL